MGTRVGLARRIACILLQAALLLPLALDLLHHAEELCACGMPARSCSCSLTGHRCSLGGGRFQCSLRAPVSSEGSSAPEGGDLHDRLYVLPVCEPMARPDARGRAPIAMLPAVSSPSRSPETPPPRSSSFAAAA